MRQFYMIAHPEFYRFAMGWNLENGQYRYTADKLVQFIASENIPVTVNCPYVCGFRETEESEEALKAAKLIYEPFLSATTSNDSRNEERYHQMSMTEFLEDEIWK